MEQGSNVHSDLATPTATIETLRSFGLYTKKRLGQHYLIDDNIVGNILDLADISPQDVVLEVGPGIGTLTRALLPRAKKVVAIEFDRALDKVLECTVGQDEKFTLVRADAVSVSPEEVIAAAGEAPTQLVANLPYRVAATVVLRFFEIFPSLESATIMVQKEVAERMSAVPHTKSYGAYTVKLSLYARPDGMFTVARNSFLPPPRVDSAVIRLVRSDRVFPATNEDGSSKPSLNSATGPSDLSGKRKFVAKIVDAGFAQRRKTVYNSLKAHLDYPAEAINLALLAAGIDPKTRAEALDTEAFITLADFFQ